jgi:hypothetical protein
MVLAGRIERRLFRSVISEAFLVQGQVLSDNVTIGKSLSTRRRPRLAIVALRSPVKLLGGDTARRILLEQATVRPRHRVLSSANPLLVAGLLYLGLGIAILQANHTLTIISMRVWPACASDRHGSPPSSRSPLS